MPAYVFRYATKDGGPWTVNFSDTPYWPIESRHAANTHCETLRGLGISAGEHRCNFVLEELEGGKFAIICDSHPFLDNAISTKSRG